MSEDLAALFEPDPRPDPCEPRMEVVHTADRILWHRPTATFTPWTSGVLWVRWEEADADRGIDEVLRFFEARTARFTWSVRHDTLPADLGARLESRGFLLEARTLMLAARLPVVGLRTNPDIAIREVNDAATMRDSIQVEHPDWDEARRATLLSERLAYIACAERNRYFAVAYLEDRPVSAARWRFNLRRPAIHLSGAETLPEFRHRGAYSTLVDHRARLAAQRGCRFATILADESTSAPILRKRGFVATGATTIYLSPAVRSNSS
jgi:GNAT superfamily N-acetyltransferase